MSEPEPPGLDLTQVLERFCGDATLIRRLAVVDDTFWSICEDYALARKTLAQLEKSEPREKHGVEIAEYVALVADLEREIVEALRNAR